MNENSEIGRVLRASTAGFAVGCRVAELTIPSFGGLVRVGMPVEGPTRWTLISTAGISAK
jgi:hypothetical protein